MKIILTNGKEIELTPEEADELKRLFSHPPTVVPVYPQYPPAPWPNDWTYPIITCET